MARVCYIAHVAGQTKKGSPAYPAHWRAYNQNFLQAVLSVLTWSAFVSPEFAPARYPEDARSKDMARIGADLYRGFHLFNEQEQSTGSTAD